ncbi:MAG: zf-HC2 domain-containing protein [Burkholderiales bacterium]|nr:zf-HC2 domain-containing protein [Burkholderiales bacterium]
MSDTARKLNCDEAIRLLFEFLDNELEQHDHAAVEAHLHDCRACFSRMEFDKRLRGMVKSPEKANVPETLRQRIKKISDQF